MYFSVSYPTSATYQYLQKKTLYLCMCIYSEDFYNKDGKGLNKIQ